MAVAIVDVNTTTFSIDGVKYLKNFQSRINGNNLKIFGVYDNATELVPYTNYSEFTVDTVGYASAVLLQEALVDVLFNKLAGSLAVDEEDVTDVSSVVKFKERAKNGNGQRGYKIIRSSFDWSAIPAGYDNAIWEIRYDFDLTGISVTMPTNVTMKFNGGVLRNYTSIAMSETQIDNPENVKIFDSSGTISGTLKDSKVMAEWFGALGNGVQDDASFLAKACNSGIDHIHLSKDKTYLLKTQCLVTANKNVHMEMNGSTIERDSTYTTAESPFQIQSGTSDVVFKNGKILDNSGLTNQAFFYVYQVNSFEIFDCRADSESMLYNIYNTNDVYISYVRMYNNGTPATGSRLGDINNCTNTYVQDNYLKDLYDGIKIEAIGSTNQCNFVSVTNNKIDSCEDTALFCRITGSGSDTYRGCVIDGNIFEDVGKSAIKYTSPATASGTNVLELASITNNTIKGYAFTVASPAIAVFRDASDTTISINNIVIANNTIDGKGTAGTSTSVATPTDARGIRCQYVDGLVVNSNVVRNTVSDGILIGNCTDVSCLGNSVYNCNTATPTNAKGGIYFSLVDGGIANNIVNGCSGAGMWLYESYDVRVNGVYNNNSTYGVYLDGAGGGGVWTARCVIDATMRGNTTAPFSLGGDFDGNTNVICNTCIDDDGVLHRRTTTTRDALNGYGTWTSRNVGMAIWNTTNADWEVWNGSSWVKADGTAVDS